MFGPDFPLKGNILFFDLDVVIHNNIDPLFTHNPSRFMIIRDFNRCRVQGLVTVQLQLYALGGRYDGLPME